MKKCVLIGGGDIGRGNTSHTTKEIDEIIVKIAGKKEPNFLFVGFASLHSDSYFDTIKKIYKSLGCKTNNLKKKNLEGNRQLAMEKIKNADILYIGGGDTIKLLEDIKNYQLEEEFKKAYNRGCIMVGYSAGAILLSKKGFSDSKILRGESNKNEFINGLGFININICPHFEEQSQKEEDLLKEKEKNPIYLLGNNTALIIEEDKIIPIKSDKKKELYLLKYQNKEWKKEILK